MRLTRSLWRACGGTLVLGDEPLQFLDFETGDLGDAPPPEGGKPQETEPLDVGIRVGAPPVGEPRRLDGLIAALPDSQDVRREAGAADHDLDGVSILVSTSCRHVPRMECGQKSVKDRS